tara:strand:- start:1023 stop:1700 length:678 start_codon:yes stop_codon:yes gene_type:complete
LIVTIHQPNYLPYSGFFHKLSLADTFVILDDTQFQFDYTNRNKILKPDGNWTRINIPIKKHQKFFPIKEVEIDNDKNWRYENMNLLLTCYENSKYFHMYRNFFEEIFSLEWKYLFDINFEIIKKCIEWLDIKINLVKESELNISGESSEKLVNICKNLGAKTYVSGPGGKKYLDQNLFYDNDIQLVYQNFVSKIYPQNTDVFVPDLSIMDLLSNLGPDSKSFLFK